MEGVKSDVGSYNPEASVMTQSARAMHISRALKFEHIYPCVILVVVTLVTAIPPVLMGITGASPTHIPVAPRADLSQP